MEKYQRVDSRKADTPDEPNQIKLTGRAPRRRIISVAMEYFENGERFVVLKALGRASQAAVSVAEVLKRRIAGLHQITEVSNLEIVDVFEPLEEGLETVEKSRFISMVRIVLSLDELDTEHVGYQPPIDPSLVQDEETERASRADNPRERAPRRRDGRGRGGGRRRRGGRGGRGNETSSAPAPETSSPAPETSQA